MISNAHIRPKKRPTKKLPPTRRSTGSEARSTGRIRRPDSGLMLAVAQWACQVALSFKVMRADDPFRDRYARGTRSMTASEIRALFAVAARPEIVSLAGGMPFTASLPFDVIGDVVEETLWKEGAAALQYGSGQGDPRLREVLVELMRLEGISASSGDIVVTVGSQQALDLLARMF